MFQLPTVKRIDVNVTGGQETHPTAGYRRWAGNATSSEPIVALAIIETDEHYSWVRSSNREDTLEIGILFSPMDATGKKVSVSFAVGDSVVCDTCTVPSQQTEPNPLPGILESGSVVHFAQVQSDKQVNLHVLFLAKADVKILKKGIWHLKAAHQESLDSTWKDVLTYGRTGMVKKC
jgi:hypothetical protein